MKINKLYLLFFLVLLMILFSYIFVYGGSLEKEITIRPLKNFVDHYESSDLIFLGEMINYEVLSRTGNEGYWTEKRLAIFRCTEILKGNYNEDTIKFIYKQSGGSTVEVLTYIFPGRMLIFLKYNPEEKSYDFLYGYDEYAYKHGLIPSKYADKSDFRKNIDDFKKYIRKHYKKK
jgi:hypothetical protein